MKNRSLIRSIWASLVLVTITSFGQVPSQSATGKVGLGQMLKQREQETLAKANVIVPTASQVLADIKNENNNGQVPAKLYPQGYLDQLKTMGNQPMMYTREQFDPSAYALKAGDKANMKWFDASVLMGSPTTEAERNSDEAQYTAIISYGFYMGNYEVTQDEYNQVMGSNPSYFTSANGYTTDLNRPVENVTWAQANAYCTALTSQALTDGSIPTGWAYRLPTEAEWEYSCRARTYAQASTAITIASQPDYSQSLQLTAPSSYTYTALETAKIGTVQWNVTTPSTTTPQKMAPYVYDVTQGNVVAVQNAYHLGSDDRAYVPITGAGMYSMDAGTTADGYSNIKVNAGDTLNVLFYSFTDYGYTGNFPFYVGANSSSSPYVLMTGLNDTPTAFNFGSAIHGGMANFDDHYEYNDVNGSTTISSPTIPFLNMTADVGSYVGNAFDLFDMHGNVAEWCNDWYGSYPTSTTVDPQGPTSGSLRVVRGGSWADNGVACRSAARLGVNPSTASSHIGFRIVLAPGTPEWKTAVTTTPTIKTYGIPPTKTNDGLVLITHGWTKLFPDQTWINTMSIRRPAQLLRACHSNSHTSRIRAM